MRAYGSTSAAVPTPPALPSDQQPLMGRESLVESSDSRARSLPNPPSKLFSPFTFLDRSYSIKTPSCLVPRINELFKSICDRYDVAVVNREKVDEALALFKQVVGVDKMASIEESFTVWRDSLTNPRFTVTRKDHLNSVKDIRMRADVIPKDKRKAQKFIRDLLDACHLFLDQKDFLQRQIVADLVQLDSLSGQLQVLGRAAKLSSFERRQLPKTFEMARKQFSEFLGILDKFYAQVFSLIADITGSVNILKGTTRESSADPL